MNIKLGIIGVGNQGSMYAKAIKNKDFQGEKVNVKGLELVAICDICEEKRLWAKESLGGVSVYENYHDLLNHNDIEAVLVVTPHYFHPEIAIAAMEKNLHVLVDKPAGVYTKQVKKMNAMAMEKKDLVFGLMFNQRFNPLYQKLKEIIDSGAIGEIRRSNWIMTTWWRSQFYYDSGDWRATWNGEGGGVLLNQCPHQIDLWQWICGMPKKVDAKLLYGFHRNISVEDDVTVTVKYENGAKGVFETCTHDIIGTDRFEINGDKGKIVVDDSNKLTVKTLGITEQELNKKISSDEVARKEYEQEGLKDNLNIKVYKFESKWGTEHFDVLENFAGAIRDGKKLIAPGIEGIRGLELTNAMHLSSWLGKEVSLPIDEDLYFEELSKKIKEEKN